MRKHVIVGVTVLLLPLAQGLAQEPGTLTQDPFQQRIGGLRLEDQNVLAGIVAATRSAGLPLSVEYPLGEKISGPAPPAKTVTATVSPGTVKQVLDQLCDLDPTFTWIRNGKMVNVIPRGLENDPGYVLNRKVDELTFENVRQADDAVMKIVGQLPGPREQIAVLEAGVSLDFARPWTTTFKDVTVREVLDAIAQQFGPSWGWQFSGGQDFRMVTFHESLSVNPSPSKRQQSEIGR
jgi:hypothetical protein